MNQRIRRPFELCLLTAVSTCLIGPGSSVANADDGWVDLIASLDVSEHSHAGTWQKNDAGLTTSAANASHIRIPKALPAEYDLRTTFTRNSGIHSVAMFFSTSRGSASFEIDAWGQHLAGIQNISGQDLRTNSSRKSGLTLQNGQRYSASVQVRRNRVRAVLNDQVIADLELTGDTRLSVPDVWQFPATSRLGLGAWAADTTFHTIEIRATAAPLPSPTVSPVLAAAAPASSATKNMRNRNSEMTSPRGESSADPALRKESQKRVLLVIANEHFFYREYADPLAALQRAGIRVDVAAGRKAACRPHPYSGEQGSGTVIPDLALSDARAEDYDAIMFSGGWGASMYQYAFRGTYRNSIYNGDRRTKETVNGLLNDFIRQDKFVGALCHGVSVLAWARVNDKSILDGKNAVASPRQSPAGNYNGQNGQPLSRWNAEVNGAKLSAPRSLGDPTTSADDVVVDGNIVTGEDDSSARAFGETLAKLLTQP